MSNARNTSIDTRTAPADATSSASANTNKLFRHGLTSHQRGQIVEAKILYGQVLDRQPEHFGALENLGLIAAQEEEPELAFKLISAALKINNKNPGNVLIEMGRFNEALESFDRAIKINPKFTDAHYNKGEALIFINKIKEAIECYDRVIILDPSHKKAYFNKSIALLKIGQFGQGWPLYESRMDRLNIDPNILKKPQWSGTEDISNKTILLHSEQGLGDTIQFCRYTKIVKSMGARVLLEVPRSLYKLMSHLDGVDQLLVKGGQLTNFDYHCPLLSLPLSFKTDINTIPTPGPYLKSSKDKLQHWNSTLGTKKKPRIGLVWSGSTSHKNDRDRSILLEDFVPHLPGNFEIVSLQKEVRDIDRPILASHNIRHFGFHLDDFGDTAALCDLMDVVISVDTSIAHLSGAMGKPTKLLLPFAADWRWLLERDSSPWYKSMRLYRQTAERSYATIIKAVMADLT